MDEIAEAMQTSDLRLSNKSKWMVWNEEFGWTVYEHKPYAKQTKTLIATQILGDALEELLK